MNITIDKDVPMPSKSNSVSVYPYDVMEIGDSFAVGGGAKRQNVYNACYRHGKRLGRKFICKDVGDSIRVWRNPNSRHSARPESLDARRVAGGKPCVDADWP